MAPGGKAESYVKRLSQTSGKDFLDVGRKGANLGEVLVTHSTDPGWTPLFLNAGALVMESGGTGSHCGIVGREYGIPAVSGIEGVTARIKTGQGVKVNGDTGELFILDGGDEPGRVALGRPTAPGHPVEPG